MKKILCGALTLLMMIGLVGCNSSDDYYQKLYDFGALTLSGGAVAEKAGNMIKSVWYNTIYEKYSPETLQYTTKDGGGYHDDFNTAISLYLSSDEYIQYAAILKINLADADKSYLEIKDPPKGCEDAFEIVKVMYDNYEVLVGSALNPTGSLQTYSESFNAADAGFMDAYNKLDRHFSAIDFIPSQSISDNSASAIVESNDLGELAASESAPEKFVPAEPGFIIPDYEQFNSPAKENGLGETKISFRGKIKETQNHNGAMYYVVSTDDGDWLVAFWDEGTLGQLPESSTLPNNTAVDVYAQYDGFSEKVQLPACSVLLKDFYIQSLGSDNRINPAWDKAMEIATQQAASTSQ